MSMPRSKEWIFLVYPDSFDLDLWLKTAHIGNFALLISPPHNGDEESEGKKHYHCIFQCGDRSLSPSSVHYLLGDMPANGKLQILNDGFAYEQYIVHYCELEKEQFYKPGEPYSEGKYCRVVGNYQFHADIGSKRDKLVEIYDIYFREYLGSHFVRGNGKEFYSFLVMLRLKHPDLVSTAIRNSYNLKNAFNIF